MIAEKKTSILMPVGIALGSNLGESEKILTQSIEELRKIHQGTFETFLVSSFYKTAPVDCPPGSPFFLNAVIQLETHFSPYDLISFLQTLEKQSGRPFPHAYHTPRRLDLDLLYYDSMVIFTTALEVPHPRIRERSFVLKPLVEINPHIILPHWQLTAQSYLQILEKKDSHE